MVVFVSGGAWIIGYKLWSALLGREFARRGYVVIVPDYRNFPQGNIEDMIEDLREALRWTVCNCSMFGGDPNKIILSGQSAGAHISLCTLVELYETHLRKENEIRKNLSQISVQSKNNVTQSPQHKKAGQKNSIPHIDTSTVLISSSLYCSIIRNNAFYVKINRYFQEHSSILLKVN